MAEFGQVRRNRGGMEAVLDYDEHSCKDSFQLHNFIFIPEHGSLTRSTHFQIRQGERLVGDTVVPATAWLFPCGLPRNDIGQNGRKVEQRLKQKRGLLLEIEFRSSRLS